MGRESLLLHKNTAYPLGARLTIMIIEKRKQEQVCNVIKALEVHKQTESSNVMEALEVTNNKKSKCEGALKKCYHH